MFVLLCLLFFLSEFFLAHASVFNFSSLLNVKNIKPTKKSIIALTFDDGPLKKNTKEILKILKNENILATFFVLGERVIFHPDLIQEIIEDGHEIGNHSFNHPQLSKLSQKNIQTQIQKTNNLLRAFDVYPTWFRPPYGLANETVYETAFDANMDTIFWSVDPSDWKNKSAKEICQSVLNHSYHGGIVLLHDHSLSTVKALPCIIKGLKEKNFNFVTLTDWYNNLFYEEENNQTNQN